MYVIVSNYVFDWLTINYMVWVFENYANLQCCYDMLLLKIIFLLELMMNIMVISVKLLKLKNGKYT